MKKFLSLALTAAMVTPILALGTTGAAAYGDDVSGGYGSGGYGSLGTYTPTAGVLTNRLLFAMPGCWQNAYADSVGCYWWSGYDTPDNKAGGYGWPGYQAVSAGEYGVDNLWAIDVPTYGNGEAGDASQIIWTNYLDGGTETDKTKNPFYDAACQTVDSVGQYWSRADEKDLYDPLFRYIYKKALVQAEVEGADELDTASDSFWEDANRLAAVFNGEDWGRLKNDEKTYQVDMVLDDLDELDLSEFGSYADNFFNEDLVGDDDLFPREEPQGFGEAFHFNNMVYVVDFSNYIISPVTNKIGYNGDFYFYYGNGEYGAWPTKALCEEMGGTVNSFLTWDYLYGDPTPVPEPTEATYATAPTSGGTTGGGNTAGTNPPFPDYPYVAPTYPGPTKNYPRKAGDTKIYFDVPKDWKNFSRITLYLYDHTAGELIAWGSKKGFMTDEGNGIWSFDMSNYDIGASKSCGCIFTADWGIQTCDLIITSANFGDTAYCPPAETVENDVDSNKRSCVVRWASGVNGNPLTITSIGNVVGDDYREGENNESLFYRFITGTDYRSIKNAVKFNGKSERQTIVDTAWRLGLKEEQVNELVRLARANGATLDWGDGSGSSHSYSNALSFTLLDDGTLELSNVNGTSEKIPAYYPEDDRYLINGRKQGVNYAGTPITAIGDWAFANNKFLKAVDIPATVTTIGTGAFYNCVSLQTVDIPDSVTYLGANAFEKCLYLTDVTLGDGITAIEDETFFDCRRLRSINIPDGVETIGDEVFYNCRSLPQLALPNGVEQIGTKDAPLGMGVFENCRALETLVIPDSVSQIAENAFEACPKLTFCGTKGSFAETFAAAQGVTFENVGNITASGAIIGDADRNLSLSIVDVSLMQRFLSEFKDSDGNTLFDTDDPKQLAFLDVDGNGKVDVNDVTMVQRFLAEFIDTFR